MAPEGMQVEGGRRLYQRFSQYWWHRDGWAGGIRRRGRWLRASSVVCRGDGAWTVARQRDGFRRTKNAGFFFSRMRFWKLNWGRGVGGRKIFGDSRGRDTDGVIGETERHDLRINYFTPEIQSR
ncbi:hypothetical protein U1Q18_011474 [Sarracenia purpurea var. burkii]